MVKQILILACCLYASGIYAQTLSPQVLASTGAYAVAGSYSVSYTVGEMAAIQTLTGGGTILTQGFQQPSDITIGLLDVEHADNGTFVVYPVPAVADLWFGYEFDERGEVEVRLYDVTGRVLDYSLRENYTEGKVTHSFDCTRFAAGNYVLSARYTSQSGQVNVISKKFQIIN